MLPASRAKSQPAAWHSQEGDGALGVFLFLLMGV